MTKSSIQTHIYLHSADPNYQRKLKSATTSSRSIHTSPTRYVVTIARSLDIMKPSVLNQLYVKSVERVVRTTSNSPLQSNQMCQLSIRPPCRFEKLFGVEKRKRNQQHQIYSEHFILRSSKNSSKPESVPYQILFTGYKVKHRNKTQSFMYLLPHHFGKAINSYTGKSA